MKNPVSALLVQAILGLAVFASPAFADGSGRHTLWTVEGRHNTVFLLGSVHYLPPDEILPPVMDSAYREAERVIMEIDLDDMDPLAAQQTMLELGMLPAGETLESRLGTQVYGQVVERAHALGLEPAFLSRFQPWLAALTLVQLQLVKMGLDPNSGVEQQLLPRATGDGKQVGGLETLSEQLGVLASLSPQQQREFLLYSLEDIEEETAQIDDMLKAWRSGDAEALAQLLQEGFDEFPDLYRPLTVDRNRRWAAQLEPLLRNDRDDYLVVVGALHLVGEDSVVELLRRAGYEVRQQ